MNGWTIRDPIRIYIIKFISAVQRLINMKGTVEQQMETSWKLFCVAVRRFSWFESFRQTFRQWTYFKYTNQMDKPHVRDADN